MSLLNLHFRRCWGYTCIVWLALMAGRAFAESVVMDAGASHAFSLTPGATNFAWSLNGVTVGGNSNSYTYNPLLQDVGTHYLLAEQILPGGSKTNSYWQVRVRITLPASGTNFFVDPVNGLDTKDGKTTNSAYQTLDKARDVVRALVRPLPAGGVTVWLRGGTYYRTSTLLLNNANDSGTAAAPVVYRSYPGETAVISGGKALPAASFYPLAASQTNRVAPGVNPTNIWELDVATNGITHAAAFPAEFNQWTIFNVHGPSYDGNLCELFYNGRRMFLSRYPNHSLVDDDLLTTNMMMDGVAKGLVNPGTTLIYAGDSTNSLNYPGTYTNSFGTPVAVGGAFYCKTNDVARFTRWQSAITNGGFWLQGYWRVPWQIDGLKVIGFDVTNRAVLFATNATGGNGIGSKYARPAGYKTEPYWALNLLEEMDQPGEWAADFSHNKIYFYAPGPITNGSVVISDFGSPLVQITGGSNIVFHSVAFEAGLAQGIYITNGTRNLVLGCTLRNMGNVPVELFNGGTNGVVGCTLQELAGGGVLLRGGIENANSALRVPARHFVVNNVITNFARVVRVYAAAVDAGYYGSGTGTGGGGHVQCVGMRVAHNRISGAPHGAVLHGSWDSTFEYNDLSRYCQVSDDLGGFYAYDDFGWFGNHTFRYNFLHDTARGDGIYFDNDHPDMHIYGNVVNLRNDPTETRGYGYLYKTGTQATSGSQQAIDLHDNLSVSNRYDFTIVALVPSVIQNNAAVMWRNSAYTWTRVVPGTTSNTFVSSSAAAMQSGTNMSYTSDIGFLNLAGNDLRLPLDSRLYADLPGFREIPFEMIGLYNDELRNDATPLAPLIRNPAGATGVTSNAATLTGQLMFPWLNPDTVAQVYWGTNDGGTNVVGWQNALSFGIQTRATLFTNLTGLTPDTTYYFRFQASNSVAVNWATNSQSFHTATVPPPPPAGLTVTPGVVQVILNWPAVDGAISYNVKRSTTSGGGYVIIANVTGLSYTNTGLVGGATYYYVVSALSANGEGADSSPAGTVPLSGSVKADNTLALDQSASWLGNIVPTGGLAVWDSTVTTNSAVTTGAGVSFSGIQILNPGTNVIINPGTGGTLALGTNGIDLGSFTGTLTINSPVNLLSNQTWITGNPGASGSSQLSVPGAITGTGGILLTNTSGRAMSVSGTNNSFSGGFTLAAGAQVIVGGISNATGSGGIPTTSYLGVGPLTLNGGVISNTGGFGLNQGIAHTAIVVNNDFAMNVSGRLMLGGAWNLAGGTRTVSSTRTVPATNALIAGGNTAWGLGTIATVTASVSNGTLRVTRDPASVNPFVSFRLASNPVFYNNAGLVLGSGVMATVGNSDITNADSSKLMSLTIDSGGYLNLGETLLPRNVTVASLSGVGTVANLDNTNSSGFYPAALTINGGPATSTTEFSGRLTDTDTNLVPTSLYGTLSLNKAGSTTQILSGNNTYTGPTAVNGGTLIINGDQSAATGPVTVASGATLGGTGVIGGSVTVSNGAALRPGKAPGVLSINGNLNLVGTVILAVARNGMVLTNDLLVVLRTNTYGGTLIVTNLGSTPLQAGDSFQLFNAGNYAGAFTNFVYPAGYTFTNSLSTDGRITVLTGLPNTPPVLAKISDQNIQPGRWLYVTNAATDTEVPPQAFTFSLLSAPANTTINPNSGVLAWRATAASAGTVVPMTVIVSDNGSPSLGATQSFLVAVQSLVVPPIVVSLDLTNQILTAKINGDAGPDYIIQASTNLITWTELFLTNPPVLPFLWSDSATSNFPGRFYRVRLGP